MKRTAPAKTPLVDIDTTVETVADCPFCDTKNSVTIWGQPGSRIAKCSECGQTDAE